MRPLLRFFDWRFLTALTVLLLVGSVCWGSVVAAREAEAKDRQINTLVRVIKDEQAASARSRERLLDGQQDLQRKYDELAEANQELADVLTARGIPLPSSVTRIERSTDDSDDSDDDGDTIVVRPPAANPTPRPSQPADDDDDNGETVPDVDDLTDMTDDIVDDLLKSVPSQ